APAGTLDRSNSAVVLKLVKPLLMRLSEFERAKRSKMPSCCPMSTAVAIVAKLKLRRSARAELQIKGGENRITASAMALAPLCRFILHLPLRTTMLLGPSLSTGDASRIGGPQSALADITGNFLAQVAPPT